jgi:hypothetical protein
MRRVTSRSTHDDDVGADDDAAYGYEQDDEWS